MALSTMASLAVRERRSQPGISTTRPGSTNTSSAGPGREGARRPLRDTCHRTNVKFARWYDPSAILSTSWRQVPAQALSVFQT